MSSLKGKERERMALERGEDAKSEVSSCSRLSFPLRRPLEHDGELPLTLLYSATEPDRARLQSATYLLEHVSGPSRAGRAPSLPSTPTTSSPPLVSTEDGHSDAIWCTKWAKLPGGDAAVVTASADHTVKLWCAHSVFQASALATRSLAVPLQEFQEWSKALQDPATTSSARHRRS